MVQRAERRRSDLGSGSAASWEHGRSQACGEQQRFGAGAASAYRMSTEMDACGCCSSILSSGVLTPQQLPRRACVRACGWARAFDLAEGRV